MSSFGDSFSGSFGDSFSAAAALDAAADPVQAGGQYQFAPLPRARAVINENDEAIILHLLH